MKYNLTFFTCHHLEKDYLLIFAKKLIFVHLE